MAGSRDATVGCLLGADRVFGAYFAMLQGDDVHLLPRIALDSTEECNLREVEEVLHWG